MKNIIVKQKLLRNCLRTVVATLALMVAGQVSAFDTEITASFVPAPGNPTNNVFTNTSAGGRQCRIFPQTCGNRKSLPNLANNHVDSQSPLIANNPDPRQGVTVSFPSDWRDISVRHKTTGETRIVRLHLIGLVAFTSTNPGATDVTGISDPEAAHNALWKGGLTHPPAPCTALHGAAYSGDEYLFIWETAASSSCALTNTENLVFAKLTNLEYLYEISTPTPLDMPAGIYEGSISYITGPGGDIDFGDNMRQNDPMLNVNITLTVEHHLQITFPPGADRLALEPEGGWIPWLNRGSRPERIGRNQPFQFTSSGPVKMHVECQYRMAENCAITNPDGHSVPVETRISLPAGVHELTGGPVTRKLLSSQEEVTAVTDQYVADQTGNLHFEIGRADVDAMLGYPDTTYSGNVTVVWDSFLIP